MTMTSLEQEITALTEKWMIYINIDGHKDRDCHWYIQQAWSYGQEPVFIAYHHGYVGSDFSGTRCTTIEEAQEELRDALVMEIYKAKEWLKREITWWQENKDKQDDEDAIWFGDPESYIKILEILEG